MYVSTVCLNGWSTEGRQRAFTEQLHISKSVLWHYASCQRWLLANSFDKIPEVVYAVLSQQAAFGNWLDEGPQ